MFKQHDEAQLEAQYAVHHDDAQLVQNAKEAAEQLRELFEADVAGPLSGLLQTDGRRASRGAAPRDPRHELRDEPRAVSCEPAAGTVQPTAILLV